jgi:hypothetical protein
MMNLTLSFDQQRKRFERHHKKISPIACDYTWEDDGFADPYINSVFAGWTLAVQSQKEDEVEMYYSRTYGWKFEFSNSGFSIHAPDFPNKSDESKAIEWAKENGFLVIKVDE